jgi:hypothetical protein
MDESHAAVLWVVFGLVMLLGVVAVYLTPLVHAFGA